MLTSLCVVQFTTLKDQSLIHQEAFIDGKWVSPKDGATIKVTSKFRTSAWTQPDLNPRPIDPATTEVLGAVPELGVTEAIAAIEAAGAAFKTWSKTTAKVCLLRRGTSFLAIAYEDSASPASSRHLEKVL